MRQKIFSGAVSGTVPLASHRTWHCPWGGLITLLLLVLSFGIHAHDPCEPQIFNTVTRQCEDPAPPPPLPPPDPPPEDGFDVVIGCSQITDLDDRLAALDPNIIPAARGGCAVYGMRFGKNQNRCMDHITNAVAGRTISSVNYMVCTGWDLMDHGVMADSISDVRSLFPNSVQMNLVSINVDNPACNLVRGTGYLNSVEMIQRAYNDGLAERSYVMVGSELLQPDQLRSDNCHPNNRGTTAQVGVWTNILRLWGIW